MQYGQVAPAASCWHCRERLPSRTGQSDGRGAESSVLGSGWSYPARPAARPAHSGHQESCNWYLGDLTGSGGRHGGRKAAKRYMEGTISRHLIGKDKGHGCAFK